VLSPTLTPLTPYCTTALPSRCYATAVYPHSSLSVPESLLYLASCRGGPIRLHSLLHPSLLSSYRLVNAHTEAHMAPHSLLIPSGSPHTFVAGSDSQLSFFDVNRSGSGPVRALRTIPTRRSPATTTTMKGLVAALALGSARVLAAGTNTRHVGLYAADGTGDVIGVFCVPDDPPDEAGGGVSQLLWSACERYLYIAERRSDVVSVYDIRNTGLRVASLRRRAAATNQRMAVSLLDGELVGGGMDGVVRIWRGEEGGEPVGAWKAHDDVVTAAAVHPFGEIVATCSGSRKTFGLDVGRSSGSGGGGGSSSDDSDEDTVMDSSIPWDNSLKIWEIPKAHGPHSSAEDKEP